MGRYAADAVELDMAGLLRDAPAAARLVELIEATRGWLADGAAGFARLEPIYRAREMAQKPGRALLAQTAGDRRAAWRPRESGPLTYRWGQVTDFLRQLAPR